MNEVFRVVARLVAMLLIVAQAVGADEYLDKIARVKELTRSGAEAEALELGRKTLAEMETAFGANDPRLIDLLQAFAGLHGKLQQLEAQEAVLLRVLAIARKSYGPQHTQTQTAIGTLVMHYTSRKMPEKVEALFRDPYFEKLLRVGELNRKNTAGEALALGEKSLAEMEAEFGANDPRLVDMLKAIASVHSTRQDRAKEESVLLRVLAIAEKAHGPDGFYTRLALDSLAHHYKLRGMPARAEPLYRRALSIAERSLEAKRASGEQLYAHDIDAVGSECANLGGLYVSAGNYPEAEPLLLRALRALEENKDTLPFQLYGMCGEVRELYEKMGDAAEAARFGAREIALREAEWAAGKKDGEDTLFFRIRQQGERLLRIGEFEKAEPLLLRALDYMVRTGGPNNVGTITILSLLSDLYATTGDTAQAEGYFYSYAVMGARRWKLPDPELFLAERRAFRSDPATAHAIWEQIGRDLLGRDLLHNAEVVNWLSSVADNCALSGERALAVQLHRKAADLWRSMHGPQNTSTAWTLKRIAAVHLDAGEFEDAKMAVDDAVAMMAKAVGEEDPQVAFLLSWLIRPCLATGDTDRAARAAERALKITEKNFPRDHREMALALGNLAVCEIASGHRERALKLARATDEAEKQTVARMLAFADEETRLNYLGGLVARNLLATLGDVRTLGEGLVRVKGLALDSVIEDRQLAAANMDPARRAQLGEVARLKRQMADLVFGARANESYDQQLSRERQQSALAAKLQGLETAIAREVTGLGRSRRAFAVTLDMVRQRVPVGGVLLDFMRYEVIPSVPKAEARYGVNLLQPEAEPQWIDLGPAERLDSFLAWYRRSAEGKTDAAKLATTLDSLWRELWSPIAKALPASARTLIVCPDGDLNFLSFATLRAPSGRFLCEDFQLRYVAAARDLLAEPAANPGRQLLVFGNPQFDAETVGAHEATKALLTAQTSRGAYRDLSLEPLPGSAEEARLVQASATRAGYSAEVFLGSEATERRLMEVRSPRILHLATHGFLLRGAGDAANPGRPAWLPRPPANPLLRSGLVLAGARATLTAWSEGRVPVSENDGIVTADEVGALQLDGTWLVTLSACDTGGGEVRAGEGVLGLRRGFMQAGTQNLLMTLWSIDDRTTGQIMVDFYDLAFTTGDAPRALAEVQRNWLVKLRDEKGVLEAVRLAGPFIMSSQGAR